jgi:hypothetical protein
MLAFVVDGDLGVRERDEEDVDVGVVLVVWCCGVEEADLAKFVECKGDTMVELLLFMFMAFSELVVVGVGAVLLLVSSICSNASSFMSIFQIRTVWSAEHVASRRMSGERRRRVRYVL